MFISCLLLLTFLVPRIVNGSQDNFIGESIPATRPFYMGFVPTSYDITPQAVEKTYRFVHRNADLIAHHIAVGVPWPEALKGQPYHPNVEHELTFRLLQRKAGQKLFLYMSPLNIDGEMAGYWGEYENMERPGKWKNRDLDDPETVIAYTNFCRDLIGRFQPDYFAYVVEANLLAFYHPSKWKSFVRFAKQVYQTIKSENPTLPVFVSLQIDFFWIDQAAQARAISRILPYSDYVAVSAYPYFFGFEDPATLPGDFFSRVHDMAPEKPFAVAETGFTAQDVDTLGQHIDGTSRRQKRYLKLLLKQCLLLDAEFLVWFVPRDYDAFLRKAPLYGVPQEIIDILLVWRDNGLLEANGHRRISFTEWTRWLSLPVQ